MICECSGCPSNVQGHKINLEFSSNSPDFDSKFIAENLELNCHNLTPKSKFTVQGLSQKFIKSINSIANNTSFQKTALTQ